jgi:hypothetical protein
MIPIDILDDKIKERILTAWQDMSESDKAHFINQVALALSVWGSDDKGRAVVIEVLRLMMVDGTRTLADFGLYIERVMGTKNTSGLDSRIRRASLIIEGYRVKNALSSEPHLDIGI